jgi:hypothetical protein
MTPEEKIAELELRLELLQIALKTYQELITWIDGIAADMQGAENE